MYTPDCWTREATTGILKQKCLVSHRLTMGVVFDNEKWWDAVTYINLNVDSNNI